jgi:hypothetical protein
MTYQRLSNAELENLKDDFIRFLASQGIDADSWQKMKSGDVDAAEEIINIYSDLVFEQALSKCNYIEHITAKEFKTIKFDDAKAHVIGLRVSAKADIDLTQPNFQQLVEKGLQTGDIEVFEASKPHEKLREHEMFAWIQQGAYMANDAWYAQMKKLITA